MSSIFQKNDINSLKLIRYVIVNNQYFIIQVTPKL